MSEKLKPCPFCGGKAFIDIEHGEYHVFCECECTLGKICLYEGYGGEYGSELEAIEAWNTRAESQIKADHAADIVEMLRKTKNAVTDDWDAYCNGHNDGWNSAIDSAIEKIKQNNRGCV